jgi:NAD(P)-dependent dehydrogenase (short-subunit alcohol dehydrogenase family)
VAWVLVFAIFCLEYPSAILSKTVCWKIPFAKKTLRATLRLAKGEKMDLQLKGKTALITGSTQGIGFAAAKFLAEEGVTVYINGRTPQGVEEAIEKLKSQNSAGSFLPAPGDMSQKAGVDLVISKTPAVDILINNFGCVEMKDFEEMQDEDWLRCFEANVLSGVRLSSAYLSKMKEKNWGRIIFISSESAINMYPELINYNTTKLTVVGVARGLAEAVVGTGITVNSVLPGPTYTKIVEEFMKEMAKKEGITLEELKEKFLTTVRRGSLINRWATPDEVGAPIAFICSPLAAAINGAAIRVEGGIVHSLF